MSFSGMTPGTVQSYCTGAVARPTTSMRSRNGKHFPAPSQEADYCDGSKQIGHPKNQAFSIRFGLFQIKNYLAMVSSSCLKMVAVYPYCTAI